MSDKKTVSALVTGGEASAGPPLGPALGPLGINVLQVVNTINDKTKDFSGMKVPVKVEVDPETKKFTVEVGIPPTTALIACISSGVRIENKPAKEIYADIEKGQFDSLFN